MKKQSDLFRWILGGLTIAGVAVAASTPPTVSPSPPPPAASAPQTQAAESASATPSVQAPQAASKHSSQIWECTTNGVKTFSDNPCGTKATRVALRPINTMEPTPVIRSTRADGSEPRYTKEYTDQNLYPDQDTSAQGFDDNAYSDVQGYPGVQGFVYVPLSRPNHRHRPEHHHDSSSDSHKPAPKPRNSAPPQQRSTPTPRSN
jgi:hypothetical protein